jgi:hypothetical protein
VYVTDNKDNILEKGSAYRTENKENIAKQMAVYRTENKDKRAQYLTAKEKLATQKAKMTRGQNNHINQTLFAWQRRQRHPRHPKDKTGGQQPQSTDGSTTSINQLDSNPNQWDRPSSIKQRHQTGTATQSNGDRTTRKERRLI